MRDPSPPEAGGPSLPCGQPHAPRITLPKAAVKDGSLGAMVEPLGARPCCCNRGERPVNTPNHSSRPDKVVVCSRAAIASPPVGEPPVLSGVILPVSECDAPLPHDLLLLEHVAAFGAATSRATAQIKAAMRADQAARFDDHCSQPSSDDVLHPSRGKHDRPHPAHSEPEQMGTVPKQKEDQNASEAPHPADVSPNSLASCEHRRKPAAVAPPHSQDSPERPTHGRA